MAINETIITGKKFRRCLDASNKIWQRISFWHKASDCEFDDGTNAQTKLGAIKGITTDKNVTTTGYAADMTVVKQLKAEIDKLSNNTGGKMSNCYSTMGYVQSNNTLSFSAVTGKIYVIIRYKISNLGNTSFSTGITVSSGASVIKNIDGGQYMSLCVIKATSATVVVAAPSYAFSGVYTFAMEYTGDDNGAVFNNFSKVNFIYGEANPPTGTVITANNVGYSAVILLGYQTNTKMLGAYPNNLNGYEFLHLTRSSGYKTYGCMMFVIKTNNNQQYPIEIMKENGIFCFSLT